MSDNTKTSRTVKARVLSANGQKSITVAVERFVPHPVYGKYVRKTTKLHAHDESNIAQVGDMVVIESCRPISKTKQWRLAKLAVSADT